MDTGERLEALERDFGQITAQLLAINVALQNMANTPAPMPTSSAPMSETTGADESRGTSSKLKPAPPSDFDGDRTKGRAFLNSCELYI